MGSHEGALIDHRRTTLLFPVGTFPGRAAKVGSGYGLDVGRATVAIGRRRPGRGTDHAGRRRPMDTDVDARGRQRLVVAIVVITTSSATHLVEIYMSMGD